MDVIISGPSVRPFCAAIACLTRMGKEVYMDFDPIDGLVLRALNDSKSCYSGFSYQPSYFSRCSSARRTHNNKKRRLGYDENENDHDRCSFRIPNKALAPIIRPRKDVLNLQLLLTQGDCCCLAMEFQLQRPGGILSRVIHKVGVVPAPSVAAVKDMEGCSEIIVAPTILNNMLEPLKRTNEIAILINDAHKVISSVTFHHNTVGGGGVGDAAAFSAGPQHLKTETSVSYDDLVEISYNGRPLTQSQSQQQQQQDALALPPDDLEERAVLVISQKELKALLQFCLQSHHVDQEELPLTIQFFWGGKPLVATVSGPSFSAELVLATLDHKLLQGNASVTAAAAEAPAAGGNE